jgi:hypothetical protein
MDPEMKKLQAKGVPPHLSDFKIMGMIFEDRIYFTMDFTQFSLIPLEGYFKWSEILQKNFPGATLDTKTGKLLNTVSPRLNYDTLQRIFRMDLETAKNSEEVKAFEDLVSTHGGVMLDETSEVS